MILVQRHGSFRKSNKEICGVCSKDLSHCDSVEIQRGMEIFGPFCCDTMYDEDGCLMRWQREDYKKRIEED